MLKPVNENPGFAMSQFRVMVLFVLFLPMSGISFSQSVSPEQQVKSLMEICQFSQAASLAELFLAADSSNNELLFMKGLSLAAIYRYSEAIAALECALGEEPASIKILSELAGVYRQAGEMEKAIKAHQKIIALAPDNIYFRLQLANLYNAEERFREAVVVFLECYQLDSSSFFVARQLGNCYNELKRSDSAIRYYRRALRINPYDQYVTGKLVNVFIREDDIAMALYWSQIYLEQQDSACIPILKQNGYCNYLLIDFQSAAKQFGKCAALGDSSKFTMKYLGLANYKQEKYDTATPFFRAAFFSDTTDAEVCFYYGVSAYRSLEIDTGLAYLTRTLRLLLPSGQFLSTLYSELADAYTSNGAADTAVVFLRKALEADPAKNTLRFKLAYQIDYYLRKPYEALPWYREFLKNLDAEAEEKSLLPQHISYADYTKKRIKEITGKK
jgi:tetratricopeptide (TPR) repeat protein